MKQDTAYQTIPGPRQIAVLEHVRLISHAEVEFEENARRIGLTGEQIASAAVEKFAALAVDARDHGQVKLAGALATVAAHFAIKYDLGEETCISSLSPQV